MIIPQNMSSEANALSKLKKLLQSNCKTEKIQPPVMTPAKCSNKLAYKLQFR
jgi:hypothetical protein